MRRGLQKPNASGAIAATGARHPIRSARLRQIFATLQSGGAEAAEVALREYLVQYPRNEEAIYVLAQTMLRLGRRKKTERLLLECLTLAPDFAAARFDYANLLFKRNKFQAALEEIDKLLVKDGSNLQLLRMKANILRIIGESNRSLELCAQMAEEYPSRPECWIAYGHALRTTGDRTAGVAAYRKAIECQPSSGLAYWGLADMKSAKLDQVDIDAIERQLARSDISVDDRIALHFSLGKAYEDQSSYSRSYENYAKANAVLRRRFEHESPERLTALVEQNRSLFSAEFLESREGAGCKAPDPIFIVGRPRSGSTLIEQILSSHSAIEGTAELPYIGALIASLEEEERDGASYPKVLETLERTVLGTLGREYMASAQVHRKLARPYFIDKNPINYWHIGLIRLILPNAKIIDARRNPAACLLSMFKQYFNKARPSLTEFGQTYRDYVRLMAHFDAVMPGKIHRVIYEDLVASPEAEIRRLLSYIGVPFEESCLRFYETERTVLTPSSEQVRKPISSESIDHWRRYEPWLGPLLRSLGSTFTEYPSVPEELR